MSCKVGSLDPQDALMSIALHWQSLLSVLGLREVAWMSSEILDSSYILGDFSKEPHSPSPSQKPGLQNTALSSTFQGILKTRPHTCTCTHTHTRHVHLHTCSRCTHLCTHSYYLHTITWAHIHAHTNTCVHKHIHTRHICQTHAHMCMHTHQGKSFISHMYLHTSSTCAYICI